MRLQLLDQDNDKVLIMNIYVTFKQGCVIEVRAQRADLSQRVQPCI